MPRKERIDPSVATTLIPRSSLPRDKSGELPEGAFSQGEHGRSLRTMSVRGGGSLRMETARVRDHEQSLPFGRGNA